MNALLPVLGIFCLAVESSASLQAGNPRDILESIHIRLDEPAKRIPSPVSVDAPLLGNGFTGVAVGGPAECQTYFVSRNDFWRLKSSYCNGFAASLGQIRFSVPILKGAGYRLDQDLWRATVTSTFSKEGIVFVNKTFVAAEDDLMVSVLSANRKVDLKVEVIPPPPQGNNSLAQGVEGQIRWMVRSFEKDVDIRSEAGIALRVLGEKDTSFTLQPGKPVIVLASFTSNFKTDDVKGRMVRILSALDREGVEKVRARHQNWWTRYWNRSWVDIPDPVIKKQYYLSLYGMGACSRDKRFPPPIFGSWITREIPWWSGDYHLNYNHSASYYGLYSANRIEQAIPFYGPLLDFMEKGHHYSELLTGIPDGIMYPVGIGPLGINTSYENMKNRDYIYCCKNPRNIQAKSLFLGQKSNAAYGVMNLAIHFYSTYDRAFTREVWPYVKAVATFWEHYLKLENGVYVIHSDSIHEGSGPDKNPLFSLGAVRTVFRLAIDMGTLLEESREKFPVWEERLSRMAPYPTQVINGLTVFRLSSEGMDWYPNNTLAIQHIYPCGAVGLDSDPALLQIARNTVKVMGERWFDHNGSNSFFPAAVRVGWDPDQVYSKLKVYSSRTYPNGFQRNNHHGIENLSTVPNTVNEMLCSGFGGTLRLFEQWPKKVDASFTRIRTYGAFLVSGSIRSGVVSGITLISERGKTCRVKNPWKGRRVKISGSASDAREMAGDLLVFKTRPGETFTLMPL